MPPADNGVDALALSSEQFGLIKLWIDEGAKGEVTANAAPIDWQSLPPGMNPIYAVALSRPTGSTPLAAGPIRSSSTTSPRASSSRGSPIRHLIEQRAVQEPGRGASRPGAVAGLQPRRPVAGLGRLSRSEALAPAGQRPRWANWPARPRSPLAGHQPRRQVGRHGRSFRRDQAVGPGHAQGSQGAGRPHGRRRRRWPFCPTAAGSSRPRKTRHCGVWNVADGAAGDHSWKRPRRFRPLACARRRHASGHRSCGQRDSPLDAAGRSQLRPIATAGEIAGHAGPVTGSGRFAGEQVAARLRPAPTAPCGNGTWTTISRFARSSTARR